MKISTMKISVVISQLFSQNAYLAHLEGKSECIIVDPGFETDPILEYVTKHRLTPAAFLNTHGHADHIAGNEAMKRCWPDVPLVIGANEADKLTDPDKNLSRPFGIDIISPQADQLVVAGEVFSPAGIELEVRECPGHSRGHVVFLWRGQSPWVVFGGDVLFRGSIGRTDLADGSFEELDRSIRTQLYTLPDDTIILPGHGEPTTVGTEKRTNPFVSE